MLEKEKVKKEKEGLTNEKIKARKQERMTAEKEKRKKE